MIAMYSSPQLIRKTEWVSIEQENKRGLFYKGWQKFCCDLF
jgi:hypothetical protein